MREYGFVMKKIALFIQTYDLASSAESGVDRHDPLLSHRRSEEQLAKVLSEYPYRLDISLFLGFLDHLICNRRFKKPLERVIKGHMDLLCKRSGRISSFLTEVIVKLLAASFRIRIDLYA